MFVKRKYRGTTEYNRVCELLKLKAGNKGKTDYGMIWDIMGLKPGDYARNEAGHLLGEISEQMHEEGKPMLSALVVTQEKPQRPGCGFFDLAIKLGRLLEGASNEDKERFWRLEVNKVYSIW